MFTVLIVKVATKANVWLVKTTAILFGGMFLWIAVFAGSAMLPPVINPILDPMIALVIGALAFVARYFFKKNTIFKVVS